MTKPTKIVVAMILLAIAAIGAWTLFYKPAPATNIDLMPEIPNNNPQLNIQPTAGAETMAPEGGNADISVPETTGDADIDADLMEIDNQIKALEADNAETDKAMQDGQAE